MNTAPSCVFIFLLLLASRWEKLKCRSQRLQSCLSEIKEKQNFLEFHGETLKILVLWNSSYSVTNGCQRMLAHNVVCSPLYHYYYWFFFSFNSINHLKSSPIFLVAFRGISSVRYPTAKSWLPEHSDNEVRDKGILDALPDTQGDLSFHLGII